MRNCFTFLFVVSWALVNYGCKQNPKEEEVVEESTYEPSYNPLPLSLLSLDSVSFQLSGKNLRQPIAAILFNPDCEHCHKQSQELARHLDKLREVTVVMISSAPLAKMGDFAKENGLAGQPNIFFAYANPVDVYTTYGTVPVPYTVLYSTAHRKIREFQGEFEVGELVSALQ